MMKFVVFLMLLVVPATGLAEEATEQSEYEREALRLKYSFWSTNIVKGPNSEMVAGLGMFGSDVDFLSQREDEVGVKFRSYKSKKTTSGVLYLASILAFTGAIFIAADNDYGDSDAAGIGLLLGSVGFLIGGAAYDMSSQEALSQSVWIYNGTLETGGVKPFLSSGDDDEKAGEQDFVR